VLFCSLQAPCTLTVSLGIMTMMIKVVSLIGAQYSDGAPKPQYKIYSTLSYKILHGYSRHGGRLREGIQHREADDLVSKAPPPGLKDRADAAAKVLDRRGGRSGSEI
jgi:hypothetical protein